MYEIVVCIIFVWLFIKAIRLAFKLTWGLAKIIASILIFLALPVLIGCFFFVGGLALLLPVAMIALAAGVLKLCI